MTRKNADRRLDLDALQVFDMVMRERNVTRAADRLALTQSAVSHALSRLRSSTGDPLFVRAAGGVRPTARAESLWNDVRDSLHTLRRAVADDEFDPLTDKTRISVAMNDLIAQMIVPKMFARIQKSAPGVFLSVPPRQPGKTEQSVLRGMLDFGIGLFSELPAPIRRQTLWTDRCVCVFRRGHPLLGKGRSFPLDLFKALPHIELTPDGDWLSQTQSALNDAGVEINLVVGVSHFSCVGSIVEASDLVAVIPSRYAEAFASLRIETRQLPVPTPEFNYELIWHERSDRHPAHRWFRDLLLSFCSDLFAGKRPSV